MYTVIDIYGNILIDNSSLQSLKHSAWCCASEEVKISKLQPFHIKNCSHAKPGPCECAIFSFTSLRSNQNIKSWPHDQVSWPTGHVVFIGSPFKSGSGLAIPSCRFSFFHFILRFWNQIFICLSVRQRTCAISILLLLVK